MVDKLPPSQLEGFQEDARLAIQAEYSRRTQPKYLRKEARKATRIAMIRKLTENPNALSEADRRFLNAEARAGMLGSLTKLLPPELRESASRILHSKLIGIELEGRPVERDPIMEARDKWLYEQCRDWVPYKAIIRGLKKSPESWPRLESINGIKKAAQEYAKRHHLDPIPKRPRGRKPTH